MISWLWSHVHVSTKRIFNGIFRTLYTSSKLSQSTVDPDEVKKFDSKDTKWWDAESKYPLLHNFNAVRVPFIRDGILSLSNIKQKSPLPLKDYNIIDVGCGGGILSEALARLGASVTGLDPGPENIKMATEHASCSPEIKDRVNYVCDTIENLALSGSKYDAVVCSEVIEHVADVRKFVQCCVELTKENGSLFFTTPNRTLTSYIIGILLAEYVFGVMPRGTHDWNKFIKPSELSQILESFNCRIISVEGIIFNPIAKKFSWCKSDSGILYALHAVI